MTPRRRSNRKRGWPANLYESRGYFSYRNPNTREWFGLGRDRQRAFSQAIEANLHLAGQLKEERLIDRLTGAAGRTVSAWCEKYEETLNERDLADNTRKHYRKLAQRMQDILGADTKLRAVTALMVSDGLEAMIKGGRQRTAQATHAFMKDSFNAAIVRGWLDENPVRAVKGNRVTVRRARLTLEFFQQVYGSQIPTWLRNAMAVALVSGQTREQIAEAKTADVRDGAWWARRGKTHVNIQIPLELRLNAFGMSLGEVIKQCRSTGVLSHYLIHQTERVRGKSRLGNPIGLNAVSARFSEAVTALKTDWVDKTPPTFHEIRSLAARLYKEQGNVITKDLLGHLDEKSTLIYEDERDREQWIQVRVTV